MYDRISGFSDEICSGIAGQFEVLNKLGIKYFEPRGINGKNISLLNCDECAELKKLMDKYHIQASSIGSPVGKINLSDDFKPHFEMYKNVVSIAKTLDCRYIRIFSFYHDGGEWTDAQRDEVFSRLSAMLDYAKAHDVVLLHENEKDIYGDTALRCFDLMRNFCCDNFAAVFDPANFVQCEEDTAKAFELLKSYIRYVHIKDAAASDGRVVPAGSGDGDVEYIISELFKTGYNGFLSLEPHLGSFEGLADLELDDKMAELEKGGEGTFTLAYRALNNILERCI